MFKDINVLVTGTFIVSLLPKILLENPSLKNGSKEGKGIVREN